MSRLYLSPRSQFKRVGSKNVVGLNLSEYNLKAEQK